jgi:hypothetical protein
VSGQQVQKRSAGVLFSLLTTELLHALIGISLLNSVFSLSLLAASDRVLIKNDSISLSRLFGYSVIIVFCSPVISRAKIRALIDSDFGSEGQCTKFSLH